MSDLRKVPVNSPWTPERVALTQKLWIDGASASEIAKKLGVPGLSRLAVIGRVNRDGLTRSPMAQRATSFFAGKQSHGPAVKRQTKKDSQGGAHHVKRNALTKAKLIIAHNAVMEASTNCAPLPQAAELEPLIGTLSDLGAHACRWPIGDANFAFCGRRQIPGSSYCEHHFERAFNRYSTSHKDFVRGVLRRAG